MMRWIPPVAGALFFLLFVTLGIWQLNRAAEKNATKAAFSNAGEYVELNEGMPTRRFQAVSARGHYVSNRQVVIDNIVKNGRLGYFVITPFRSSHYPTLVAVNRGWVQRSGDQPPEVAVGGENRTVRGKVGGLPRVGIRPGPAFEGATGWPRMAVWPELADLESVWGEPVASVVMLLDPEDADGYLRDWQPPETGSFTHYSYAFQWFAMAIAVLAILAWNFRRKRLKADANE